MLVQTMLLATNPVLFLTSDRFHTNDAIGTVPSDSKKEDGFVKENQQTGHVVGPSVENTFIAMFSPFARFQILCRGYRSGSGHTDLLFTSISTTRLPFGKTRWSRGIAFYTPRPEEYILWTGRTPGAVGFTTRRIWLVIRY
jgi:hypothetical protein